MLSLTKYKFDEWKRTLKAGVVQRGATETVLLTKTHTSLM